MCLKAKNVVEMKNYLACTSAYLDKLTGTKPKVSGQMLLKGQMNSMMLDDLTLYHTDDILVKVDRAGMRVSLENRIPMLDRDVLEFALSLPISYKFENGVQKRVLKEMLYRYVPKELMDRPKTGFAVPLRRWLTSGTTGEWAASLMNDLTFAKDGFLSESACKGLWQGFLKGKEPAELVWYVLMLEQWYQNQYKKLSS
jgi:asparagine synthase (glutamine-hydrolysing)